MRLILSCLAGLVAILIVTVFATTFLYMGWNWGAVPALTFAKPLGFFQTFWFMLCVSTIGNAFKSTLSKD